MDVASEYRSRLTSPNAAVAGLTSGANIVMAMSNAGIRLDFNDFEKEKGRIEANVESVNPVVVVATNPAVRKARTSCPRSVE